MTRLLVCVLLIAMIPSAVCQSLAGHRLVVRRYNRLDTNPASYSAFFVDIKANGLALDAGQIADQGALVLTAPDQQDAEVAALLQGGVFSVAYRDGQIDLGSGYQPLAQRPITLRDFGVTGDTVTQRRIILDALDKPIVGATAEIRLERDQYTRGPRVIAQTSDSEGAIMFPAAGGFYRGARVVIRHERYGVASLDTYFDSKLPLVAYDDPAAARAFSGRIIDGSGKPIEDALVTVDSMRGISGGAMQVLSCTVMTDADGRFRNYPTRKDKRAEDAELIPPGVAFSAKISNPADRSMPAIRVSQMKSGCELVLANNNKLRRFIFQDADGNPFDAAKIQNVAISGPGAPWMYGIKDASEGRRFVPGRYEAELPADRIKFDPVTIDAGSPDVLVFRIPRQIAHENRVTDTTTSRPLSGSVTLTIVAPKNERMQVAPVVETDRTVPHDPSVNRIKLAGWFRTGTSMTLTVPANVPFGLFFKPDMRHPHVAPLRVEGPLRVAPGETLDLGVLTMTNSVLATVQVVGPDDMPIEGVPVRNRYEVNGQITSWLPCTTDAQGLAFLDVCPGMKGAFMIALGKHGGRSFRVEVPCDCPAGATELPIQKINLTAEQVEIAHEVLGDKPKASQTERQER